MLRKYPIYLHIFPLWILRRKLRKVFSPLNFPLDGGGIYIETVMATASKAAWFPFAKVNQGLKSKSNQASAGGLEWELIS